MAFADYNSLLHGGLPVRHYFGYDIEGRLSSVETYGPAGWPNDLCMEDPNCDAASVTTLRERRAANEPHIINWVVFDCPCSPANGDLLRDCVCFNEKFAGSYVNTETGILVSKPAVGVYVDDVLIEFDEVVTRDPGTQVSFKLVSAFMPDQEVVTVHQRGTVDVALEDQWDLTFVNGETASSSLTAPAQGSRGAVFIAGKMIRPFRFFLRGFQTPA